MSSILFRSIASVSFSSTFNFHLSADVFNAHRAALGKIGREKFLRTYFVTLMQPDGSTIQVRYPEPRYFAQLPVDLKTLSEHERRLRVASRKKKVVLADEEEIEDDFDFSNYTEPFKKAASG